MGFISNQLSLQNYQDHLLKTLKVVCQEQVQQADNTVTVTLPDTPNAPLTVVLTPLAFTAVVDQDKVFNTWTLQVAVTGAAGFTQTVVTTYQEEAVICPIDLTQWPGQTVVQKHDVEFRVIGEPTLVGATVTINFVINYCLVVAKEVLVKVNGAIQFC